MGYSAEKSLPTYDRDKKFYITRREVVGLLGTAAVINHVLANRIWDSGPTTLSQIDHQGPPTETAGIVFPGAGSFGGESMARQIHDVIPQKWAYYTYNNGQGIQINNLTERLLDYQNQVGFKRLDVFGSSMGGVLALETIRKLAKKTPIRLGTVFLDSAPFDLDDAYGGKAAEIALRLPYDFRLAGKGFATLMSDITRYGMGNIMNHLRHAGIETVKGASTELFKTQINSFTKARLYDHIDEFRKLTDKNTRIAFAASDSDDIVNNEQAGNKWVNFWGLLSKPVKKIELPYPGHADEIQSIYHGTDWLQNSPRSNIVFSKI